MKNYLVIGGSSGIGLELVKKLSATVNQVFVFSRSKEALENLENLENVKHIKGDTLQEINTQEFPEVLDGVIYCPGSINLKPFRSLKPDIFRADFEINVIGAVNILRATFPNLKKSPTASVVLFSTVAVGQGMPFHASVATAKGAVEGLTRSLAAEWASKIRVNCIAPSLVDTPLTGRILSSDDRREASAERHPMKKIGTPEEVADLAEFLLTEKSSWITGQIIGIDGGMSSLKV